MKLPNFKRLNIVDFTEEQQALVEKLADSLNIGIDSVYLALANRLTFTDNFSATQKSFQVTVNSLGIPVAPIGFRLNTNSNVTPRITGSQVIVANNLTNPLVFPTATPFLSYTQNGTSVNINHIAGLPAGYNFELTVVIFH
jgi:hypothetical protein